MDFYKIYSQKI